MRIMHEIMLLLEENEEREWKIEQNLSHDITRHFYEILAQSECFNKNQIMLMFNNCIQ